MEKGEEKKPLLCLGEVVPDFEAVTTHGKIRLSDFKGKWVILFSHPADFTPVCTTEFVAFAQIHPELAKRNVQLIGLSIDSVYSHIAWVRTIKEKLGVTIPFPIIADLDMKVANLFGMIHPKQSTTAAVRCVFVIDPEMRLRAMIYYPLNVGRNMDEILRLIDALQTADKYKVALPANWRPGDPVIVPAPATQEDAEKRLQDAAREGYECLDWFLCKKKLPQ
ncbi:MAG: peroxiredoxin [Candidatus Bathyarchaeota archaeon]|nr:peroxiredoxin [Candidatus Bathyarchaeota archaeon]